MRIYRLDIAQLLRSLRSARKPISFLFYINFFSFNCISFIPVDYLYSLLITYYTHHLFLLCLLLVRCGETARIYFYDREGIHTGRCAAHRR